jgi:hypothetical protein
MVVIAYQFRQVPNDDYKSAEYQTAMRENRRSEFCKTPC